MGGRTLTASEALRAGLVTRVLWPDRFQVELLPTLKAMSEQSSQVRIFTETEDSKLCKQDQNIVAPEHFPRSCL